MDNYYSFTRDDSSLIDCVLYNRLNKNLIVKFKNYYTDKITYLDIPEDTFLDFQMSESPGRFYTYQLKNKYKMEKEKTVPTDTKKAPPKRINIAKDAKRYIKIDLDATKINKDFLIVLESGSVRLKCTLHMMPNGTVDKYGRLGFITQDVPSVISKSDNTAKGEILGNAEEIEWNAPEEKVVAKMSESEKESVYDDLPF